MRRPRIAHTILIFVISMLAASCSFYSEEELELEEARERWASAGLTAYEFHLQRSCFCGPEYTAEVIVEVVDGVIQTVRYADDGEPIGADRFATYETVEDIFDIIEDAIARDAEEIVVTYDPEYGYPRSVQIDYDYNVADEEIYLYASDVRPL